MRVLLVADFYPPHGGGLEAHVERLAQHLVWLGHDPTVVTVGEPDRIVTKEGVEVVRTLPSIASLPGAHQRHDLAFPPPWKDRRLAETISQVAERIRPDVVHAHGWCMASAEVAATRHGLPLVVTLHDYGLLCPTRSLLRDGTTCSHLSGLRCLHCPGASQGLLKRVGLGTAIALRRRRPRSAVKYLAVSQAVALRHASAGYLPVPEVIPNFIDVPVTKVVAAPAEPTILFVGPEAPYKGLTVVEDAHRLLIGDGDRVWLHHVGGGQAISEPGLVYRSGRLGRTALQKAYEDATLVAIAPVWEEPCPTVALEAMAAGRPIVAAAIGGLPDIVVPGVTGVLVPPRDPSALAAGIASLIHDPERCLQMGEAARERLQLFSSESVVQRIVGVYDEVIGTSAA